MSTENQRVRELIRELEGVLAGEVRFDRLTRLLYSTDASDFQKIPVGVVIPKNVDDICAAVTIANRFQVPIIPRGSGSSLSGQTIGTGLVIDHSKYLNRILNLNLAEQWVEVETGLVLDVLNAALAGHGLMVGPDPSSSAVATLGGMIGNNSTGSHSFKYGMTADYVREMELVLADGKKARFGNKTTAELPFLGERSGIEGGLYRAVPALLDRYRPDIESGFPRTWRNVAGYRLNHLLEKRLKHDWINLGDLVAGSEGTLAAVTRVRLGLVEKPAASRLLVIHYDQQSAALADVPLILEHQPAAVELMSYPVLKAAHDSAAFRADLTKFVDGLPGAVLIVEFTGSHPRELADEAEKLKRRLFAAGFRRPIIHCRTPEETARVWNLRKALLGLLLSAPGDTKPIWIIDDASVPVDQLVPYTEEVVRAGRAHGIEINFDAHASAGCLHMTLDLNLRTADGLKKLESLAKELMTIAIAHQGTTTGEHGEGLARSCFNRQLYGPRLHQAFGEVKALFDPHNRFNPGKIVEAIEPWDTDWLLYHPHYRTPLKPKKTYFDYAYYGGFDKLVEMCNGQGICRSQVTGTMCPTYRVTRDERDSTRGRANALRCAMTGQLGPEGLNSPAVYEALDRCLECKACRNDCASRVDMAKLKYEFLAWYQEKNGIPLRSRLFGNMALTSAIGSKAPRLANKLYQSRWFREGLDRWLGIDKRRQLPALAGETFRSWFRRHAPTPASSGPQVLLWDDCHLTYHQPEIGIAAVRLLAAAGYEVCLPPVHKCCGRPVISKGMLKAARKGAQKNVDLLAAFAGEGIPIVGLEPSCIACLRDEYPDLIPTETARLVAGQSFFFEEFVTRPENAEKLKERLRPAADETSIKVHTHCYQKAFGTSEKALEMLRLIPGSVVEVIDSGCCGLAGSFGYEKEHYELSMAIGEQSLFPAIRQATGETVITAAGTSCRQQIKDGTGRQATHPAVLLARTLTSE